MVKVTKIFILKMIRSAIVKTDLPQKIWICDGCRNISKRDSPCRHSFCSGVAYQYIMVRNINHTEHGKYLDCPCRETKDRDKCADSGCGFCKSERK